VIRDVINIIIILTCYAVPVQLSTARL